MPLPSSSLRTSWSAPSSTLGTALAVLLAGLAFACAGAGSAGAQDKPACERFDWSVSREQALFSAPDLKTVPSGAVLENPTRAVALELQPSSKVAYAMPPGRQPKTADSYGGVVSIASLPNAGIYQVTASAEAWIDVIQNGKAAASVAHTGKRDCADIRKSVRFELQRGPITLQVSGAAASSIKLAVLPAN
ncbi:MAG: hypothetical protein ACLPPF_14345 [Rhodomicrobium sp.]